MEVVTIASVDEDVGWGLNQSETPATYIDPPSQVPLTAGKTPCWVIYYGRWTYVTS